jgi:UPF0271 protein
MKFDLNCDLGEGEPRTRTEALMRVITSANVACGGHAGTPASMRLCVRLAKKYGVRLGAHPGVPDAKSFGRGKCEVTPDELERWLQQQVGTLQVIAREHRVRLHHIKLHGALYHATEVNPKLARRYVAAVARQWPRVKVFARARGRVVGVARRKGLAVWEEAFLDRGYRDDGALVPRSEPGALPSTVSEVIARLRRLQSKGEVLSVSGKVLSLRPQTLCIHSDTPHALVIAKAVASCDGRDRGSSAHCATKNVGSNGGSLPSNST